VQNLSACTVQLEIYSPCGPFRLYRASVPVEYSYISTRSMGRTTCKGRQCLYIIAIPLFPYGPYELYRASVPVQYGYTCTCPMGRTACTEPQCLYSIAIPVLSQLVLRPLQSLSACTVYLYRYFAYGPYGPYRASVPVQYSKTSTPPMDRTTSTEFQCLYSIAISLNLLWAARNVQSLSTRRI